MFWDYSTLQFLLKRDLEKAYDPKVLFSGHLQYHQDRFDPYW